MLKAEGVTSSSRPSKTNNPALAARFSKKRFASGGTFMSESALTDLGGESSTIQCSVKSKLPWFRWLVVVVYDN